MHKKGFGGRGGGRKGGGAGSGGKDLMNKNLGEQPIPVVEAQGSSRPGERFVRGCLH